MIDQKTERLINRKLDGELTESESLELNKALIRSPNARALFEDYQETDVLASDALLALLSDRRASSRSDEMPVLPRRRPPLVCNGLGVAVAAVLVVMIGGWPPGGHVPTPQAAGPSTDPGPAVASLLPGILSPSKEVINGPRRQNQSIQREVIGVFDQETQSIYFLERDHIQTTTVPEVITY